MSLQMKNNNAFNFENHKESFCVWMCHKELKIMALAGCMVQLPGFRRFSYKFHNKMALFGCRLHFLVIKETFGLIKLGCCEF